MRVYVWSQGLSGGSFIWGAGEYTALIPNTKKPVEMVTLMVEPMISTMVRGM